MKVTRGTNPQQSATQPPPDASGGGGSGSGGDGKDMGSLGGERSNVMAAGNDSSAAASDALENPADVLRTMRELNEAQTVRNEETFGPCTNDTVVIAIQGPVPSSPLNSLRSYSGHALQGTNFESNTKTGHSNRGTFLLHNPAHMTNCIIWTC